MGLIVDFPNSKNSKLSKLTLNEIARWYPLKPVVEQIRFMQCRKRFRIINAGRRSGKTENAKRYLIEQAMAVPGMYFVGGPTTPQVKKIYWKDLIRMSFRSLQKTKPNKADLIINFDNGSEIHLIGMEHPKRFEGPDWTGGILDEFAYYKPEAWAESIRPALSTENPERPGFKPWCIILSKPNGLNHFYDLFKYAESANDPEWEAFHWLSSEVLSKEEIEAAQRTMSPRQFREEYLASFETVLGRIYEDFGKENYVYSTIQPDEEIHYFCDFNFTPMSHGIAVIRGDDILVLDEIILTSAKGWHNAREFVEKYKDHENKVINLYGDRSGRNGENHRLETEYLLMEEIFEDAGWEVNKDVQDANPGIKDRHNCVNAKILNAAGERSLFVDPINAPWTCKGLGTVTFRKGSAYQEDEKNQYQHITTAIGYFCCRRFPIKYDCGPDDIKIRMWG